MQQKSSTNKFVLSLRWSAMLWLLFNMLIGVAWAATVQTTAASDASSRKSAKPLAAPVILVLGDSLSAGFGLEQDKGWVHLLQKQLHGQHYPHRVINASISGETTQGGASRINRLLAQYHPHIVLLELGGNDGLRGLPLDVIRSSLAQIIKSVQSHSAQCILIGMRLPPNYGLQYTRDFARLYKDLARQYRLPLVPFLMQGFASNFQLIQADGIHPTEAAQPLMLQNVWPILLPILRKEPP